jgi:hypothetical protein
LKSTSSHVLSGDEGVGAPLPMWDLIFSWPDLVARGYDAVVYLVMAAVATVLFVVRLAFAMTGSGGSDFEVDADFDSDVSFTVLSVLSILAFFMGAGWMGLACRLDWGFGRLASSLISSGFGLTMMLAASGLSYLVRRLNRDVAYDVRSAIGRTGRVYLTIPEKGRGHGQVEVSVSGRRKVLRAVSAGPQLLAFSDVKIIDARDDETLVVEALP